MKKIKLFVLAIIIIPLFSTCHKDQVPAKTQLSVSITQNPSGGAQVNSVSAKFQGSINGTVKPVSVTAEWWWEDGYHSNSKIKSSTEYTFDSGSITSKSTVLSAPTGYILLNYYWVKITWTDDDGQHSIESSKAYCTR